MKARTGPIAWLAYLAVRVVLMVMQCFPIHWNLRTACLFARIWAVLMPRHRRRAIEHLRLSLGDGVSEAEILRLADGCLASTAMFAVESMCMPRLLSPFTWSNYIDLVHFEEMLALMVSGRGCILVTGHYGSFELIAHILAALGFDMVAVMRPLDNVYLNRYLVHTRRIHGLTLLDKKGAVVNAEAKLNEGALVGFIGDQDAGRKGIFVDFFGRSASTYKSIGLLAMATQRAIVVGYVRRKGRQAKYEVGVQRIIHPSEWADRADPLRWITQTYTSAIEAFVREDLEQYLWIHRRWKSQPKVRRRQAANTASSSSAVDYGKTLEPR